MHVSCFAFLLVLACGWIAVLPARAQGTQPGVSSAAVSSMTITALSRQIAFVKSFSAKYPYQFRQGESSAGTEAVIVDDLRDQKK